MKSAQFPVVGKMPAAEYHTPGAEILGQQVNHAEKTISIDSLLISHAFIPDIDEAMNHYDVRSQYASIMGERLANTFDKSVMKEIVLNSRASATVTDGTGGLVITDADLGSATADTKAQAWIDALYDVAAQMDLNNAPKERYCALLPADFYFLARWVGSNGFSLVNKDYDGKGSIADGTLTRIAGIDLIPCNTLPHTNLSADTYHSVNASTTKAVVWTKDAVGTVKLMDLSIQSEWDIRRQGTLLVGRYAYGHGGLRPECSAELRTATPS